MPSNKGKTVVACNRIAFFVISITSTTPLLAQQNPFAFEFTPFAGYTFGGEFKETDTDVVVDIDDAESYGLILNARHSAITQWEIIYSRQKTSADTTGLSVTDPFLDINFDYLQAGGTYEWDGDNVRPYLAATLGVARMEVDNAGYDSDSFFSFSVGLGLQVRPSERLGLRLEGRAFGTLLDSDTRILCQFDPTDPICAVRIDGTVFWQFETFAGLVLRF